MNLTKSQQKGLIAHMIKLANADGQIDPRELIFVQSIALKLQLTAADVQDVVSSPDRHLSSAPYQGEEQLPSLFYLLSLMTIDLNVDDGEKQYLRSSAYKLRLSSTQVDKAVAFMEAHVSAPVSLEVFLEEMKEA